MRSVVMPDAVGVVGFHGWCGRLSCIVRLVEIVLVWLGKPSETPLLSKLEILPKIIIMWNYNIIIILINNYKGGSLIREVQKKI